MLRSRYQKQNYHVKSYECVLALTIYYAYNVQNTCTKFNIPNKLYQVIMLHALHESTYSISASYFKCLASSKAKLYTYKDNSDHIFN